MDSLTEEGVVAYLGLGSNLGDQEMNLAKAMTLLEDSSTLNLIRSSSTYKTSPWGYTDQPDFLNCVLEIETCLSPVSLLTRVKEVEQEIGRRPSRRYGPRLIDVDILLYGNSIIWLDEPDLQIPHPRMDQRAFVLVPLAELDGKLLHPTLRTTVGDLALSVKDREGIEVWKPPLLAGS